jgi:Bacterial extracellular solute-binding protein, family 7
MIAFNILPSARLVACALALAVSMATVHAADIKERTLKLPVVTAIDHPLGVGAVKWSELVETKSGGKIKMKVYAGGTLGAEVPVISSMQGGTIEASVVLPANLRPDLLNECDRALGVVLSDVCSKLVQIAFDEARQFQPHYLAGPAASASA